MNMATIEKDAQSSSTLPMTRTHSRLVVAAVAACALIFLLIKYGPFFQNGSPDYVLHFELIDEIMQHGRVSSDAMTRIAIMALYPPIAHWMAAILGWWIGSGLVAITILTVAAAFFSYLIALRITADTPLKLALFFCAFLLLSRTASFVGWEVVANFFFPQLVGDALYFLTLWCMLKTDRLSCRAGIFIVAGAIGMWLQPLNAVQIIGAGCVLLLVEGVRIWHNQRAFPRRYAAGAVVAVIVAIAMFLLHPELKLMRFISTNNGALEFRYGHIMLVAGMCGAICILNAARYVFLKADKADAVISSAGVAAFILVMIQFISWKFHGDGSAYAVKKHMFIVFTIGVMNGVRLVGALVDRFGTRRAFLAELAAPVAAAYMATFALQKFTEPLAPTVQALDYARAIAAYQFPSINAKNTVVSDNALPLISNALVSKIAFNHQMTYDWWAGKLITDGVPYVMVRRSANIDQMCKSPHALTDRYAVVDTSCLTSYTLGETLNFSLTGNGYWYKQGGWGFEEPWGTWSLGNIGGKGMLSLPKETKGPLQLEADGMAYITPTHSEQRVVVNVNGHDVATWTYDANKIGPAGHRTAAIPTDLIKDGKLTIVFKAPNSVSPMQDGGPSDMRVLGLGLKTLTVQAAP